MHKIFLNAYEDCIGTFEGIEKNDSFVSIRFKGFRVIFKSGSVEAKLVEDTLTNAFVGIRIAVLKTDLPNKPIVVRKEGRREVPCQIPPPEMPPG